MEWLITVLPLIAFAIFYFLFKRGESKTLGDEHTEAPAQTDDNSGAPIFIDFNVKGLIYRSESAKALAKTLKEGDIVQLERERDNIKDVYAIKVMAKGECIGYVEKKYSLAFSTCLDTMKYCLIDDVSKHDIPFIRCTAFFYPDSKVESYIDTPFVSHVTPYMTVKIKTHHYRD